MRKYVQLFEEFGNFGPEEIGGAEHTKSWMGSVSQIDEKIMNLRMLMESIKEGEERIAMLQAEMGMSELKAQEKAMLEDIRVGLESIEKTSHKAHGLLLKLRKGHVRWDSPSKEDILGMLSVQIEGAKELIEEIKTDPKFKKPVTVSPTIKATFDDSEIKEAEEMPWYRKAMNTVKGWLSSLRRKIFNVADSFEDTVNQLENSISMETEMEPVGRRMTPPRNWRG
jgi:uncharacterized small protein (DUF1192 family)